jgi:hypothetical protein
LAAHVDAPDQLSQQAGFPDARFADEGHGSAPPRLELLEEPLDGGQLGFASDKWCGHPLRTIER